MWQAPNGVILHGEAYGTDGGSDHPHIEDTVRRQAKPSV